KKNDLKAAKAVYFLSVKFSQLASDKVASYVALRAASLSELSGGDKEETRRLHVLARDVEKLKEPPTALEIEQAKQNVYADAAYYERLGTEAMSSKNFERAEGFYLAASLVYPTIGKLWTRLGETREALARSKDEFRWAAMTYEKAIQVSPEEAEAYLKLGLLESEQSNWARAYQALQQAEEIAPEDPLVKLALGKHFFARKDFRAANESLRAARRINPAISEVSYYQGQLYKISDPDNPRSAMRSFEEAYSKDPGNYDALAEWLKLKVVTFEKMFAVKFLRNMIAADPQNPQLLWAFGEVYSANKEFNRAIQYYIKALDIDKSAPKVRLSLARALASLGRVDEAISEFKLASDLNARNGEGYFYAAELLYQIKNYPLTRDLLEGLLKVIPNYPGARRLLAMSYQSMNQPDRAIQEMTLEARANPMNYQFSIELAELFMANQKFVEATKELAGITNLPIEKTVVDQRSPTGFKKEPTGLKNYRTKGLLLLSRCYRQLKSFEAADGAIQSALALDPESLDLKLERGFVYHSLGRYRDAAKDFNEFLNKNPNGPEAPTVKDLLNKTVIEE
ncbi:MAG: tetratricopeptide repeat protein, partial [Pseudomonadota bacterium]